jgi:hypothetical protein
LGASADGIEIAKACSSSFDVAGRRKLPKIFCQRAQILQQTSLISMQKIKFWLFLRFKNISYQLSF